MLAGCGLAVMLAAASLLTAQSPNQDQTASAQGAGATLATVHGLVRNAASGEPLPRALVRIDGDASTGTLTDGDGHFELPGVPTGPQVFEVLKPGFLDAANEAAAAGLWGNARDSGHSVMVAAEMPDVIFNLTPANAIRGQIQLSTSDPGEGVGVVLLRQAVQDGRTVWQVTSTTKTNSEGVYRFGGLADGSYAIYTQPAMESDPATNLVEAGNGSNVARSGYASLFYPEARDLAGASKLSLAGGDQAEANLSLTLEPFHTVTAAVALPGGRRSADGSADQAGMNYSVLVLDAQGRQLPYSAQYDAETQTVQTILPDGTYSLMVTATSSRMTARGGANNASGAAENAMPMTGQADFSVAGRAVTNLRIPLAAQHGSQVQVTVIRTGAQPPTGSDGAVFITLSQIGGWITDGMVSAYAQGNISGPLETSATPPGSYWVHTSTAQKSLCEGSFTAGGASLAREPLVLSLSGSTAPLNLALRDDCATLTLALPPVLAASLPGEEKFYTVYVVPDFDSTTDVVPQTLRPSTGATVTLKGLTPGSYHVYAFDKPIALAYRSQAALAAQPTPGLAVTLSPGATSTLVVGVPEP